MVKTDFDTLGYVQLLDTRNAFCIPDCMKNTKYAFFLPIPIQTYFDRLGCIKIYRKANE